MNEANAPFRRFDQVCAILDKHERRPERLIPILQEIQEVYRYLPREVLTYISGELKLPAAQVFGVATFYAHFALEPKGRYVIRVCNGTACHVKNSTALKDAIQKKLGISDEKPTSDDLMFTLETVSCIGACGLAPAMTVNDEVHGMMTVEKLDKLIDEIKAKDEELNKESAQ